MTIEPESKMDENLDTVLLEPADGTNGTVVVITLANVRKKNAVTPTMLEQLIGHLQTIAGSQDVRALVLRGAGNTFCSGFDLQSLPDAASLPEDAQDFPGADILAQTTSLLRGMAVPTIAALEGFCMGAGGELAASCDFRVGSGSLRFAMPPAKLGLVYALDGLMRFVDIVGAQATKNIFLRASPMDGEALHKIGFLDVLADDVVDTSLRMASEVSQLAPMAVQGMKRVVQLGTERLLGEEGLAEVQAIRLAAFRSADHAEAKQALAEKRPPVFGGS